MPGDFAFKGCRKIQGSQIIHLLKAKDFFLFDCDGVLWHGEHAINGAPKVVNSLIRQGKNVFFVTNNCTRPRENYVNKFYRLGFTDVIQEQIFSSSYCSALYLRDVAKVQGQVFVIGGEGVRKELREAGIPIVEDEIDATDATIYDCALTQNVKAVLMGHDDKFTFLKLARASCYLRDPECLFLATDNDPWHPLQNGRILPGSGCLTAALEVATGRKATVIGKPSRFMFECISSQFPLQPAQCLMVGDRLETDMLFGANCGLDTMLTLTGVSQMKQAESYRDSKQHTNQNFVPDYVVDTIADFLPAFDVLD
ncbi:chronophin-like [Aplochiton taeniatus]